MGTKSLTFVYDEIGAVVCLYGQYDGYPSGHGAELAEFLSGFEIVNGFGRARPKLANGMGCLAAQIVAHFKTETGNFYLLNTKTPLGEGEDFAYHVYKDRIKITDYVGDPIFTGTHAEFADYCKATL